MWAEGPWFYGCVHPPWNGVGPGVGRGSLWEGGRYAGMGAWVPPGAGRAGRPSLTPICAPQGGCSFGEGVGSVSLRVGWGVIAAPGKLDCPWVLPGLCRWGLGSQTPGSLGRTWAGAIFSWVTASGCFCYGILCSVPQALSPFLFP